MKTIKISNLQEGDVFMYKGGCFQWFKDTKMKANHNVCVRVCVYLFSKDSES